MKMFPYVYIIYYIDIKAVIIEKYLYFSKAQFLKLNFNTFQLNEITSLPAFPFLSPASPSLPPSNLSHAPPSLKLIASFSLIITVYNSMHIYVCICTNI